VPLGLDYAQSGVSYMVPIYLNRMAQYRLTAGGSHRVSNALLKSVFEQGGQIRTSVRIKQIIVENGTAKGVELEDGTRILANTAVVSTIDTHQTFLKYVGEDKLDRDFVEMIRIWQWEKWSLCVQHLALAERPQFAAAADNADLNDAFIYVLGYESLADLKGTGMRWGAASYRRVRASTAAFRACTIRFRRRPGAHRASSRRWRRSRCTTAVRSVVAPCRSRRRRRHGSWRSCSATRPI